MSTIALLATGDELTTGDILNTNGQSMARNLTDTGLTVGMHLIVSDHQASITKAINFLLIEHDILIIIGGLGPTTDDRTRFALSKAVHLPLEFSEESWQRIVSRLTKFGLSAPENNRQQALFPTGATIYPNANGTADACALLYQNKLIFMLPGPPAECLPIFQDQVLPAILATNKTPLQKILRWRAFGVSEGHIAEQLEEAIAGEDIIPGYRVDYPYIEFKCPVPADKGHELLIAKIEAILKPHFLSDPYLKASEVLYQKLTTTNKKILIQDEVTQGLLENLLHTPATHAHIRFHPSQDFQPDLTFNFSGLTEHWNNAHTAKETSLTITTTAQNKTESKTFILPYRPLRILRYAAEYLSNNLLAFL